MYGGIGIYERLAATSAFQQPVTIGALELPSWPSLLCPTIPPSSLTCPTIPTICSVVGPLCCSVLPSLKYMLSSCTLYSALPSHLALWPVLPSLKYMLSSCTLYSVPPSSLCGPTIPPICSVELGPRLYKPRSLFYNPIMHLSALRCEAQLLLCIGFLQLTSECT